MLERSFPYLSFLDAASDRSAAFAVQYDPLLVVDSYLIAALASFAVLIIADHLRGGLQGRAKPLWLMLGATAMGIGMWGMHFVGMLAVSLPLPIAYDTEFTLASVIPAIVATGICLEAVARPAVSASRVVAAGITMVLGIGAMHYIGMAGMQVSAEIRYEPVAFFLSILIAAVLAISALWTMFRIGNISFVGGTGRLIASSAVMALAITCLHYMGIWAAHFFPVASADVESTGIAPTTVAGLVLLAAVSIMVLGVAAVLMSRRVDAMKADQLYAARVKSFVGNAPDAALIVDREGKIVFTNSLLERLFGYSEGELPGQPVEVLVPEGVRNRHSKHISAFFQNPSVRVMGVGFEVFGRRKDGTQMVVEIGLSPIEIAGEARAIASVRDVTARKRAQMVLRRSEARLREAQRVGNIGSWERNVQTGDGWWSEQMYRIYGEDPQSAAPTFSSFIDRVDPEDRQRVRETMERSWSSGDPYSIEFRIVRRDGTERIIRSIAELRPDEEGRGPLLVGTAQDHTEARQLEEQLQQAQKMEAVGQLTGGIAHDFNNLLTIILGNLQLVNQSSTQDESLQACVRAALEAGFRGAELTKRLLAFSRQQRLEPQVTDIDTLVTELGPLLRTTLSENITLTINLVGERWLTEVDPSQMESSLVNLVVNAQDAMPNGGTLAIKTANVVLDKAHAGGHGDVPPGEYVKVSVSDTGAGIPEEVLARVFEPFFSTKDVGKGTGLGLSMVYGFVMQSKGYIDIWSEEGHGTTLEIYLPRSQSATATTAATSSRNNGILTGQETILVVEDQAAVRDVVTIMLRNLGYRVLEAGTGPEALALLDKSDDIDLLFTDVVMPGGMTGMELVSQARQRHPDLKVLYTTGFSRTTVLEQGAQQSGELMLNKPYRKEELAAAVRETLDGGS